MTQGALDIFFDGRVPELFDETFRAGEGNGRILQNSLHDLFGFVFQFVRRDDSVDESDLPRPLGADQLAGKEQLAEIALAQLPPQKSHDETGDKTTFRFRITDF